MRLWSWRLLSLVSVVATAAAIITSQAWTKIDVDVVNPPFVRPAVADALSTVDEISDEFGREFFLMSASPPQNPLWQSERAIATEIRASTQPSAWEEEYQTADATWSLTATIIRYGWSSLVAKASEECTDGGDPLQVSPPARTATVTVRDDSVFLCADVAQGSTRLTLKADVFLTGTFGATTDTATAAFDRLLLAEYQRLDPSFVDDPAKVQMPAARVDILRIWLLALLGLIGFSVIPPILADRATWGRIVSKIPGRFRMPWHTDVEAISTTPRARSTALDLVTLAVLLWALRATEEAHFSGGETLAALLAAFAATAVVQRVALGRGGRRSGMPKLTLAGTVVVLIGAGLSLLIAAAAIYLLDLTISFQSLGVLPGTTEWEFIRGAAVAQWLVFFLLLGAWLPLALARRIAMALRRDNLADAGRPPVLLLRSFVDDRVRMRVRRATRRGLMDQLTLRRWERFEEVAAASLARIGPVVAVGMPGERLPPELGATRITLRHDDWQGRVAELTEHSAMVAMILGRTEGLVWEIRRLREAGLLHKTLFLLPPVSPGERRRRLQVLSEELSIPWGLLDPVGSRRAILAVCFPLGSAQPGVIVSGGQDDVSYEAAIDAAMSMISDFEFDLREGRERTALEDIVLSTSPADGDVIPAAAGKRSFWSFFGQPTTIRFLVLFSAAGHLALAVLSVNLATGQNAVEFDLSDGPGVTALAGWYDGRLVVLSNEAVYLADPQSKAVEAVGKLDALPYDLVIVGGDLCYNALLEAQDHRGQVGCFDLEARSMRWSTSTPLGTRALAVQGDRLFATSPATDQILALDASSGAIVSSATIRGVPWGLVSHGDRLFVSLLAADEVVEVDPADLEVAQTYPTVPSPSRLFDGGSIVWVHSSVGNEVVPVGATDGGSVLTRVRAPSIAAAEGVIAVEGYERLSVFQADEPTIRLPLTSGGVRGLWTSQTQLVVADRATLWILDVAALK